MINRGIYFKNEESPQYKKMKTMQKIYDFIQNPTTNIKDYKNIFKQ